MSADHTDTWRRWILWCALWACFSAVARADFENPTRIVRCELIGGERTSQDTVCGVLPRALPAGYAPDDVDEFARRLANLQVFDHVAVRVENEKIIAVVREKWTLIPRIEFSSARKLEDTYFLVGATEYNVLGSANRLGVTVAHSLDTWVGSISYASHLYRTGVSELNLYRDGWEFEVLGDDPNSWRVTDSGLDLSLRPLDLLHTRFRFELDAVAYHESVERIAGDYVQRGGWCFGSGLRLTYDHYRWDDYVPSGLRCAAQARGGMLIGADEARVIVRLDCLVAVAPTSSTALVARLAAAVRNPGNPNSSVYLGSREVRGLADGVYWNGPASFFNLELRQRLVAWRRIGLQIVAFADAAAFRPMSSYGALQSTQSAISFGGGVRIVPTFLSDFVPRFDVGTLLAPERRSFWQLGFSQYF